MLQQIILVTPTNGKRVKGIVDMKTYKKSYISSDKYGWELYALNALENYGIAPKIIGYDKIKKEITMEFIEGKTINIYEIHKGGDSAYYRLAQAECELEKILDEAGVDYHDWKAEHVFYYPSSNNIRLIDFDSDPTEKEKFRDKDKIKKNTHLLGIRTT